MATKSVTFNGIYGATKAAGSAGGGCTATRKCLVAIGIALSDETTALTTGTNKAVFYMPYAMTLSCVRIGVTTAPTCACLVIDIQKAGATIFSTQPSIISTCLNNFKCGPSPVLSCTAMGNWAKMSFEICAVGACVAGAGLKAWLIGKRA